jgi:hypothetical protein
MANRLNLFRQEKMPWGWKEAALLPHSKTWRRDTIPDIHIDDSKETITIRDKHPTRSPYLPPGLGVQDQLIESPINESTPELSTHKNDPLSRTQTVFEGSWEIVEPEFRRHIHQETFRREPPIEVLAPKGLVVLRILIQDQERKAS